MDDGEGWNCTVLGCGGDIELEQLDLDGCEWLAVGPGGEDVGPLRQVLTAAAAARTDPGWITAVVDAVGREIETGERRSSLLVIRSETVWFHVTFASNRQSIRRHGLDWRYMTGRGIAGSTEPEWPGIFLCDSLQDARFFVSMGISRAPVDIWAAQMAGQWLESAPSDGGGEQWMICPEAISRRRVRLLERDLMEP